MKKYSFFLLTCSLFPVAHAQLTVKPNSYLYVKDTLYVKQDIKLEVDSNIYLRNGSQLLQGRETTTSTNSGSGKLSVYQEGNANQFSYNYWCSPVGEADPVLSQESGNTPFKIRLLRVPTTSTRSSSVTPLAMNNYNSVSGSMGPGTFSLAPYWIFKFLSSNNYSSWIPAGRAGDVINPGEGFTMKGASGTDATVAEGDGVQNNPGSKQRYEFSGRPNNGDITVTVGAGMRTLTGNPYPSALDVKAFLTDPSNSACTGIAYYWEQAPGTSHTLVSYLGGYGTYSPLVGGPDGTYTPATFYSYRGDGSVIDEPRGGNGTVIQRRYAPIGQGFKIQGAANGTVTLKNSHRVYARESGDSGSTFQRSASRGANNKSNQEEEKTALVIRMNTIINNTYTRQMVLAFLPEATDGVDRGIDAKIGSDLPNDVSFLINNENYVIQGLQFDIEKKIPLVVKAAANSTFKFSIVDIKGFDENQDIYLHDLLDNSFHNLKTSDYTVNIATAGTFKDRFEITFKSAAALSNNNFTKDNFTIAQNNTSQTLTIYNPGSEDIKSVIVYDISGKLFSQYNNLGTKSSYQFPTSGMSTGVYLVKLTDTANKTFTQKIIVNKTK